MNNIGKDLIYDYDYSRLDQVLREWGFPGYRIQQLWQGLYIQLWDTPEQFTTLPTNLRNQIFETYRISGLVPIDQIISQDKQTTKILFELQDGKSIETVLMKYDKRRTLCISTQAGCAMGCTFCATGQMGFSRNLTQGEIVEQVLYFARVLKMEGDAVSNIVFMGMGEPFHNYNAVMSAIDTLNHKQGFNLGSRRFTISTVGLVPAIGRFTQENSQVNLAISLHAATDELRNSMLPVNKRYPIRQLIAACKNYTDTTKRRITFEWALIQEINDTPEQAWQLVELLKGITAHVNVIPLNPTSGFHGARSQKERILQFTKILEDSGIPCTIRIRRGIEIQAGCGQLSSKHTSL